MNRWITLIIILLAATTTFGQALTGTWVTTVTPPIEAGVPPFQLVFTFNADGTLLATGTGGELPALGNPCHGVWTANRVTYVCFDFDSSLQNVGMDKIRGVFDVTARTLTGRLDLTNFDPNGNEVFNACCATIAGTRLEVERLPEPDAMREKDVERFRRQ
jgi:hypothetical protein